MERLVLNNVKISIAYRELLSFFKKLVSESSARNNWIKFIDLDIFYFCSASIRSWCFRKLPLFGFDLKISTIYFISVKDFFKPV